MLGKLILFKIFTVIVIVILGYIYKSNTVETMTNKGDDCKNVETLDINISPINYNEELYEDDIRSFYIKTAYNCCAMGDFKNGYVNVCAMKNCIKQGARCLDMCVYNIDHSPEIAVSDSETFMLKGSKNSIPLGEVFTTINDFAFNPNFCPNSTDPLFLHLRIKSAEDNIYTKIANSLNLYLKNKLLDTSKYGHEYYSSSDNIHNNIGSLPLNSPDIQGKIILMVQMNNGIDLKDTHLDKYINICSVPSNLDLETKTNAPPFLMCKYNNEIKNTHSMDAIINSNKQHMTICLPDLSKDPVNYNSLIIKKYGCQFIAMSFQTNDAHLQTYNKIFDKQAFILKPANLRYIKQYIDKPKENPPHIGLGTCQRIDLIGPASQRKMHI